MNPFLDEKIIQFKRNIEEMRLDIENINYVNISNITKYRNQ